MAIPANQRPAIEEVFGPEAGQETLARLLADASEHALVFLLNGEPVQFVGVSEPIGINSQHAPSPGQPANPCSITPTRDHPIKVAVFASIKDAMPWIHDRERAKIERCHGCVTVDGGERPDRTVERLTLEKLELADEGSRGPYWRAHLARTGTTSHYVAC